MKEEKIIANSSNIYKVDYDATKQELGITFKPNMKRYEYTAVPESVYRAFISAPSAGKFFFSNIKGKYE